MGFDALLAQSPYKLPLWPIVPGMGQVEVMEPTEVEGLEKKVGGAATARRQSAT
jgi:hypothetical protein